mgnify:CR=1 FL=1
MKKIALLLIITIALTACKNDDDTATQNGVRADFQFTHNFDGDEIENSDFEVIQYTNAHGEELSVSKIVYLISDITFTNAAGTAFTAGDHNLVNVREESNLLFTPDVEIPEGEYNVSFTFGFDDEDNIDGAYTDLNSADGGWNVPAMLGGGYHYMRLEGRYIDDASAETGFQYHTIRAADNTTMPITLQDTSFEVSLGQIDISEGTTVEVKMNIAEWFKNPNEWDLNVLGQALMPNFDAQIMMSENGTSVFSKGTITN